MIVTEEISEREETYVVGRVDERRDVLAWLDKRLAAIDRLAPKTDSDVDRVFAMQQQLSVLIGDLRAGLHEGGALPIPSADTDGTSQEA